MSSRPGAVTSRSYAGPLPDQLHQWQAHAERKAHELQAIRIEGLHEHISIRAAITILVQQLQQCPLDRQTLVVVEFRVLDLRIDADVAAGQVADAVSDTYHASLSCDGKGNCETDPVVSVVAAGVAKAWRTIEPYLWDSKQMQDADEAAAVTFSP